MEMERKTILGAFAFVSAVALSLTLAYGQTTPTLATEAARMDQLGTAQGETKVIDKLSAEFSSFLGADSKAVVSGLRNGTPITVATTTPGTTPGAPPTVTTTTINPPTGKMGFGNVFISLALAKQQLNQLGITQPTPDQLQAALLGGTIMTGSGTTATTTNLQGILTMRSDGMGWGQIAQKLGFKLGPVVSGLKAANQGLAARASSPTGNGAVSSTGGGVVTGSGKSGIVTGSGPPVGSPSSITTGHGAGQAKGHSK